MALETLNDIVVTKGGWPALWERGGATTRRGSAVVITEPDGAKPRPILVRTRGHLACGQHALVGLRAGMYVIYAGRSGAVSIKRIVRIGVQGQKALAEVEEVSISSIPPKLQPAVQAAKTKADTYHCRFAVWVDSSAARKYGPGRRQLAATYDEIRAAKMAAVEAEMEDWERELLVPSEAPPEEL
jgi:hypothetical protein